MGKTRNGIGFGYRTGMASKGSHVNQPVIPDGALQFEETEDYIFFENDLTEEYIIFEN